MDFKAQIIESETGKEIPVISAGGIWDSKDIKLYERAANLGSSNAEYALGEIFNKGRGVDKNEAEALRWYLKAAEHDHTEAHSEHQISGHDRNGIGKRFFDIVFHNRLTRVPPLFLS